MLSATLLICRLSCFFALDAYGIISAIGLLWITISLPFLTQRPPTTGLCHCRVLPRLSPRLLRSRRELCAPQAYIASATAKFFCFTQSVGYRCGWLLTYTTALSRDSRHHAASTSTDFASDFRRTRRYPGQSRNFTALRRYVGRIRSSLQSRCQPINKLLRPAAFVQRAEKTTFAGLRSVRLRGKRSRLWCRRLDLNQRHTSRRGALPTELRLHIAPSGRSRSPAHQERREKRKRMEMQSLPLHLP